MDLRVNIIHNDGTAIIDGVRCTNQCMWIVVCQYLNTKNNIISVQNLKKNFGLSYKQQGPRTYHEVFDDQNNNHVRAIQQICKFHNFRIRIFPAINNGDFVTINPSIFSDKYGDKDCKNVICVAYTSSHFSLITDFSSHLCQQSSIRKDYRTNILDRSNKQVLSNTRKISTDEPMHICHDFNLTHNLVHETELKRIYQQEEDLLYALELVQQEKSQIKFNMSLQRIHKLEKECEKFITDHNNDIAALEIQIQEVFSQLKYNTSRPLVQMYSDLQSRIRIQNNRLADFLTENHNIIESIKSNLYI
jgi:hypothetical protein